ncbi:FtsX-like permease family protein [Candidatus Enterococcus ferrettii]|uniref:ABC3 transporter permease C-terminal domain-containing protein n=1 Tax=Candidatus Enterococcus ferrettii TaxID=2815324 RepID=A0ABV0EVN6_9ENTE|nr:FtsX-like permease family protein [Enterococcus sp. 665A]MBO1341945.1 FtsX-like permease family protein [Enterococcus sp. 665A]
MYLNLILRNAQRSLKEYLIYTVTLTVLISIICLSNIVSTISAKTGIEGSSLPALIVLTAVAMLHYMNQFFLKQRSKELATYSLLGMNKNRIAQLICVELFCLGVICLLLGSSLGAVLFSIFTLSAGSSLTLNVPLLTVFGQNLVCLLLIELFTALLLHRKIRKMPLGQLMEMKAQQEQKERHSFSFWKKNFTISALSTVIISGLIIWDFDTFGYSLTSILSLPLMVTIYCFYKTGFIGLREYRRPENIELYENNRILRISKLLSNHRTNALLYTILSLCLLFAFASLAFANALKTGLFSTFSISEYMIFLQSVLSFIFTFLYFCLLSLLQMVDSYQTRNDFRILHYLGKDVTALKKFSLIDLLTRFLLPIVSFLPVTGLLLLGISTGNFSSLLVQSFWASAKTYFVVLSILGILFSSVTYQLNTRTIKEVIQS